MVSLGGGRVDNNVTQIHNGTDDNIKEDIFIMEV